MYATNSSTAHATFQSTQEGTCTPRTAVQPTLPVGGDVYTTNSSTAHASVCCVFVCLSATHAHRPWTHPRAQDAAGCTATSPHSKHLPPYVIVSSAAFVFPVFPTDFSCGRKVHMHLTEPHLTLHGHPQTLYPRSCLLQSVSTHNRMHSCLKSLDSHTI